MTANAKSHFPSRPGLRGGFTLIELLAVLVVTGILAGVAIPALSTLRATRGAALQRLLIHDLTLARETAIGTGRIVRLAITGSGSGYTLLTMPSATAANANGTAITRPGRTDAYVQTLGSGEFAGVTISSWTADAGVNFDWSGRPSFPSGAAFTSAWTVTLSTGQTVTVQPFTGVIQRGP